MFESQACGSRRQTHDGRDVAQGDVRHNGDTYAWFLARWAKRLSWKEVAEVFHTSWEKVFCSVEMAAEGGLAHRKLSGIEAIGIDEIAWNREGGRQEGPAQPLQPPAPEREPRALELSRFVEAADRMCERRGKEPELVVFRRVG